MLDDTKINLEQAEKMALIGNMYGNLAHQINNPLMIILSLVQLLIDAKEEGDLITENESLYDFLMEIPNRSVTRGHGILSPEQHASQENLFGKPS